MHCLTVQCRCQSSELVIYAPTCACGADAGGGGALRATARLLHVCGLHFLARRDVGLIYPYGYVLGQAHVCVCVALGRLGCRPCRLRPFLHLRHGVAQPPTPALATSLEEPYTGTVCSLRHLALMSLWLTVLPASASAVRPGGSSLERGQPLGSLGQILVFPVCACVHVRHTHTPQGAKAQAASAQPGRA